MTDKQAQTISRLLSLVLRHKPEEIGIKLDENGWTDVPMLLSKLADKGHPITLDQLRHIVETNNKKRFAFNADESCIRANQGHSIEVDLGLIAKQPPQVLYHGTAIRFLDAILQEGLKKMNRQHVHLSADEQTARMVGSRHGKPVILLVKAGAMADNGHIFYQSTNGVWLTEHVPVSYLSYE
ncbi:RNA 2'-phosphotransferase [Arsenicibacter rosenii]|uniref:Probable RNA 2'-phosphotransferase n=1 Tax=Arsenicibacter rosenii TaxID=1750698 RepID=A0A1S2VBN8_9BACT|nr:RNA 2'-phosphotransferase [Arsenicibacter rosenii]OIN56102.1 RNA--NAD 2'-phosphotransferase [Arsenicibacter rosenii]